MQDAGLRSNRTGTIAKSTGVDARRCFEDLRRIVAPLRETLLKHPIYTQVDSLDRLREFMQIHVFAVWDFMSLVKRLQSEVTCHQLPWLPPARRQVARFANEVVLGEESDLGPDGKPASHFELYLDAMDEVGARTVNVRTFIASIDQGKSWETALKELNVPAGIADFVSETLRCAIYGSVVEVASYFFFGREDVIPEMFKKLLALWSGGAAAVPHFAFYLERHIELDGDSHGPWAQEMLMALAGQDEEQWMMATDAARRAITSRIRLWDSVVAHLQKSR
ncbi:MAG TPA: DUF3050 domain-containing protein [Candidatus Binataceae bacterium]|nr:DUF3050 domain-containing protein [Candidatus Binataceae bacterium]